MGEFMLRLIMLTATVMAGAAVLRFALGPAHLRGRPRANNERSARPAPPARSHDDDPAMLAGASQSAPPSGRQ